MSRMNAYIEHIIYSNPENHYAVLEVSEGGEKLTAVGTFPYITEGESIEAEGEYTVHPIYGRQFSVSSYQSVMPEGADAIERYLAGGAIKGIGPALAKRIVKRFKADTFRIMEEEPERLAEVKGISEKMAQDIAMHAGEKRGMRDAFIFMQELGISPNLAQRIYDKYGPALYAILKKNPYQLAEDIDGVGFRLADSIAKKAGLAEDCDFRIRCGILYTLSQAIQKGHTWLPRAEVVREAAELLCVSGEAAEAQLAELQIETKIIAAGADGEEIYLAAYYFMEKNTAQMLEALNIKGKSDPLFVKKRMQCIQNEEALVLDEKQAEAVQASVDHGVLILTGGPGTGKTTTINTMIRYYEKDGLDIALAAPTGRAAKRMAEATGREAKTIHRFLEYTGEPKEGSGGTGRARFLRDEKNPVDADIVIVDEMSMVDIFLMEALLRAIVPGTRLILVGDANQLPSVGAGNVLKDLLASEQFCTVRLSHIFRQAAQSDIVMNAHRINSGVPVDLGKQSKDFLFIREQNPQRIIADIKTLLVKKLPGYVKAPAADIQVLTPTRKGALGVELLNRELQAFLNPPAAEKDEKNAGAFVLRTGDKVMQIKNDYDIAWTRRGKSGLAVESGCGVFNGDMGLIEQIDRAADTVTVRFDEDRLVEYDHKHVQELELAYAVTVHKSQGSEYPAVIMPMYHGPHMLMNRNLLYTAVTRAKKCVCMVGLPHIFEEMEKNETENKRYSGLCERIKELCKAPAVLAGQSKAAEYPAETEEIRQHQGKTGAEKPGRGDKTEGNKQTLDEKAGDKEIRDKEIGQEGNDDLSFDEQEIDAAMQEILKND